MKNLHLVPIVVQDIAEKMLIRPHKNENSIYITRMEAIRDFCNDALRQVETKISAQKKFVRK